MGQLIGCGALGLLVILPLSAGAERVVQKPHGRSAPDRPPLREPAPRTDPVLTERPPAPLAGRKERPLQPRGEVLLRISGADGTETAFDRHMLEALPQVSFETTTLWTEGDSLFTGPALRDVLAAAGIRSGKVELWALNDYMAELDVQDLAAAAPIIATRRDGLAFGVRDNGPLWVIFPYDADANWRTEEVYAASVWQLMAIRAVHP